jgi:ectoine hydroxylase
VVLFDRRVWHARSDNHSAITRKAVFFGYTYRWVRTRDKPPNRRHRAGFTPVQRQLLGMLDATDGDHAWGHEPGRVPLYELLRSTGRLDPRVPPLRP